MEKEGHAEKLACFLVALHPISLRSGWQWAGISLAPQPCRAV